MLRFVNKQQVCLQTKKNAEGDAEKIRGKLPKSVLKG